MAFPVPGLDEIKRWILSFGPEAVALEPPKLRELVRKDLSRNLAQYSTSPASIDLGRKLGQFDLGAKTRGWRLGCQK
jgi:hypothetical protein